MEASGYGWSWKAHLFLSVLWGHGSVKLTLEPCPHAEAEVEETFYDEYPLGSGREIIVTSYYCPTCKTFFTRSGAIKRDRGFR